MVGECCGSCMGAGYKDYEQECTMAIDMTGWDDKEATERDVVSECYCGSSDFEVSATLIGCKNCGRVWGRCEGIWRYDYTSAPEGED